MKPKDPQHNVKNTYAFTFFYWAARSILFQQIISGYIFVLTGSNQPVGMVKGIQGISQLVFAFPAGYLADHTRRDTVLEISGIIGIFSALLTLIAVEASSLTLVYVAFGLWGLFSAFQSPAMEALFADSIPHGRRSYPFTLKYNVSNIAQVIGPFCSIMLFLYVGDVWQLQELRPVLIFGSLLAGLASLFLFRYDDDLAISDDHSANPLQDSGHGNDTSEPLLTPSVVGNDMELEYDYSDVEEERQQSGCHGQCPNVDDDANEESGLMTSGDKPQKFGTSPLDEAPPVKYFCFTSEHVPWLLFLSDFIISNGAGMTINFFPLFFMRDYGLSPIQVSVLFLVQPIVVMALSFLSQVLSRKLGRMPIIVWTRIFATFCLLCMAYAQPLHLQIMLFLMRGGMMRCSQPLRRSVLMDHVRREVRARWNALEGLSVFSYSGSAVIGGYIVDSYDYRTCFFITSFVYFAGLALELFLLPLTKHAVEK